MHLTTLIGLAAGLATHAVNAACSGPLSIDDFSKWSSKQNSLGTWTSDDSSMPSISAANGVLSFKPNATSYFYETLPCQAASSNGYNSITFQIKGPAQGSATLEIQTKGSCSDAAYSSKWVTLTGLTGNTQTITIPLTQFSGANTNAITGFVWSTFSSSSTTWQISKIAFGCSSTGGNPTSTSATRTTMQTVPVPTATGTCAPLVIDDWVSQSRLTFLFYNAMGSPTSDDSTMTSITVGKPAKNRVEFVPKDGSYFYSQFRCVDAQAKGYNGISLRIKAPQGASLNIQLDSSDDCDPTKAKSFYASSKDLGWQFDGSEKLYTIPFGKFSGLNIAKLTTVLFSGYTGTTSFGPMAFYCGNSGEYIPPPTPSDSGSTATVPAPSNAAATGLVIDRFANANTNAMGNWHGGDEGMTLKYASNKLTITSPDADYAFYTQVSGGCSDFTKYKGSYLHIAYSGTTDFTVAFQQHNSKCDSAIAPYPETWDSAEAKRYASNGHIYIPINHFNINLSRVVGFALKGFHTKESVTLSLIEIVSSVPSTVKIPSKDETGNLVFACKRPNSFAFAIDDGQPDLAQEVLKIIREENIKVTFFTVGAPLLDDSTNLTNVYKEMSAAGHQLALHSFTHPKMEGLPDYASIDWEYNEDVKAMKSQFNGYQSKYFRPPFGNEGARMRSRLTKAVGKDAHIVNWSVDVEDWLWAETDTPEQQKVAFQRDVNKGGNLVVLHYLYPSTVSYLREFIQIAKKTGKQLMRVDQCMMDPNAPPL
ncbi:carbohydrate esterase family 4 protein [Bipolaris oryzae ATCC 44560]|uniref:Carbohydrate esterase family 4 protein n=1 Tax=Bipolaris oryzae ATCC 44560 TaxID=930090 RepID=W7A4H1_COCMI|nr:carbohydrate esterase family 4 protein [Bipolaris oryzae ATCC 44560]EUC51036.1 carbohydrate esterase family 4 protein [Bipolaris oryzae ATCC 44560]